MKEKMKEPINKQIHLITLVRKEKRNIAQIHKISQTKRK